MEGPPQPTTTRPSAHLRRDEDFDRNRDERMDGDQDLDQSLGTAGAPPVAGNGHGPGRDPQPSASDAAWPRKPPGPSTRLALIVVGIAAFLTVVGAVAAGVTGSPGRSTTHAGSFPTAAGSPLHAVSGRTTLAPLVTGGLPPQDVMNSVALPQHTRLVPASETNNGVGLYDHSVGLAVPASTQDVIEFFRAEIPSEGWHVLSQGASSGASYRIIAQRAGSNGSEWEVGATVMPETFAGSSTQGASSSGSGTTPFTLRLFEVSDAQ